MERYQNGLSEPMHEEYRQIGSKLRPYHQNLILIRNHLDEAGHELKLDVILRCKGLPSNLELKDKVDRGQDDVGIEGILR